VNGPDEETALATIFANTRRKKRPDNLVTVAESFAYLAKLYGSQKAVAEKVDLSTEIVRQFLQILELPRDIKEMISDRRIDRLDVAYRISKLRDAGQQMAAAKIAPALLSKDMRDIERLVQHADIEVEDSERMVMESKPKELHVFIVDFDKEVYNAIRQHAKQMKMVPSELIRQIVMGWVDREKEPKEKHATE
jgi:hypothetical protein